MWFSLWDFHAPNELIELENLSLSHLPLSPSLESHRPWADLGWGVQNLFNEQTGRHYTAQSKLIPPWNWPCFSKDCSNQTAAQQYLQRTPEESWHSTPWQHKPGLVFVTVSHLYPCSLVPFTNPWQRANQTKMPILEFWVSRETLEKGQLICYILFLEHQKAGLRKELHTRGNISATFHFGCFKTCNKYHLLSSASSFPMVCSHTLSHRHLTLESSPTCSLQQKERGTRSNSLAACYQQGQRRTLMHLKGLAAKKDCDSDWDHLLRDQFCCFCVTVSVLGWI